MERMKLQLGKDAEDFFHALQEPAPTSIRLHHQKGKAPFPLTQKVKWCDSGYYLNERPFFHLDPHWHGGAYYVQEASSMILNDVLRQISFEDKPKIWLDLCAAPGGKTGILAKHMNTSDVLIANEVVGQRKSVLYENMVKGGFQNVFISGEKSSAFPVDFADVILVDAPCSGEGMMRKEPEAANQWSERLVQSCSELQKDIIRDAISILKPGGWLIYSTCSYSQDENIENVRTITNSVFMNNISLSFPIDWQIEEINKKDSVGYQLYPHKVKGEGLFISVFEKQIQKVDSFQFPKKYKPFFNAAEGELAQTLPKGERYLIENQNDSVGFITSTAESVAEEVCFRFPNAELISRLGEQKGRDFVPAHFLAMSAMQTTAYPIINLDLNQSLDYLERKVPLIDDQFSMGWYQVQYDGTMLGWLKNTGQMWKNHYPMNWRLRKRG